MNLQELAGKIEKRFSVDELKDLFFRLHIAYADLPEATRKGKIRELVQFCERHDRLDELIAICKEIRPSESWTINKSASRFLPDPSRPQLNRFWLVGSAIVILLIIGLINFLPFDEVDVTLTSTTIPSTQTATLQIREVVTLGISREGIIIADTSTPTSNPPTQTYTPNPPTSIPSPTHTLNPPAPTYTSTPTIRSFTCAIGLSNYSDIITSCRSDMEAIFYFSTREIENRLDYAPAYRDRSEAGYRLGNIERQNGNDLLADQYLNGAIQDCNTSVNLNPDWALLYYNCGFVYWSVPNRESDTLEKIIINFEKYLELAQISEPSTPAHASYYRLGEAYRLKDGCEVALPYYQNALEYAPNEVSIDNAQQRIDLCTN